MLISLPGCVQTAGQIFEPGLVDRLVLGQTTTEVAFDLMGPPQSRRTVTKNGTTFTMATYIYGEAKAPIMGGDYFMDLLVIEFFEDTLHGYIQLALDNQAGQPLNIEGTKTLERDVSTKQDVLNLLGRPNGKALSPSNLDIFEDAYGDEIWVWLSSREEGTTVEVQKIVVGFKYDGRVDSVSSSVNVTEY
ncbi:outer membrane protein assembly factor BamE [Ruficoccus sp. ZRK36]|uniref:outer membrane protein assembly factor BamE n=1 Tax=Ruficoccus sp. ZRK36 TaxID=2866311 RepID=UPI001C733352|nr:outer membrane protein assembly factor BamE [Ruficoccus sp. ZRK36]QYY36593.1 outer membrane protein assembly factor BamE [Ruficoccus sp. ZRK36]